MTFEHDIHKYAHSILVYIIVNWEQYKTLWLFDYL